MPAYRTTATVAAILSFIVFAVFAFIPVIANFIYGIDGNPESNFILLRASFLLLGLGVMCWMTRDEPDSVARRAISMGFAIGLLGIMLTGIYYWFTDFAGNTIWLFILIEAIFGTLFLLHARNDG